MTIRRRTLDEIWEAYRGAGTVVALRTLGAEVIEQAALGTVSRKEAAILEVAIRERLRRLDPGVHR